MSSVPSTQLGPTFFCKSSIIAASLLKGDPSKAHVESGDRSWAPAFAQHLCSSLFFPFWSKENAGPTAADQKGDLRQRAQISQLVDHISICTALLQTHMRWHFSLPFHAWNKAVWRHLSYLRRRGRRRISFVNLRHSSFSESANFLLRNDSARNPSAFHPSAFQSPISSSRDWGSDFKTPNLRVPFQDTKCKGRSNKK